MNVATVLLLLNCSARYGSEMTIKLRISRSHNLVYNILIRFLAATEESEVSKCVEVMIALAPGTV
jgi:uncharacterized membrane protein